MESKCGIKWDLVISCTLVLITAPIQALILYLNSGWLLCDNVQHVASRDFRDPLFLSLGSACMLWDINPAQFWVVNC